MKATEEIWLNRIREWKASGLTAKQFAEGKPYRASSLTWRQWQLQRSDRGATGERQSTPKKSRRRGPSSQGAPRPAAPVVPMAEVIRRRPLGKPTVGMSRAAAVVVEVGQARIEVGAGFDAPLLRDVVRALQGAA